MIQTEIWRKGDDSHAQAKHAAINDRLAEPWPPRRSLPTALPAQESTTAQHLDVGGR